MCKARHAATGGCGIGESGPRLAILTIVRCAVKAVVGLASEVLDQEQLETIAARVAELLKTERQHRKLSMSTVAERAGLSQQMVSYVERGMRNPTLDTLLRMTAAMKLDPAELLAAAQRKARKHH